MIPGTGYSEDGVGKKPGQTIDASSSEGKGIKDLFTRELKKVYWMELTKVKIIERLLKHVDSINVVLEFEDIQERTMRKIKSLENIFEKMNEPVATEISEPVKNIYAEAEKNISVASGAIAKDSAIILILQQAGHFEIATYTMLISFMNMLEEKDIVMMVLEILQSEKEAMSALTDLAETFIHND